MFSLICAWTFGWEHNRDTGDLRSHHAHYDVTIKRNSLYDQSYFGSSHARKLLRANAHHWSAKMYWSFNILRNLEPSCLFFNQLYGLKVQHAGPRTHSTEITSFPLPLNITAHAKTIDLTHCGLVTPYCDRDQHWCRQWLAVGWHQAITWTNDDWSLVTSCGILPGKFHGNRWRNNALIWV